MKQWILIAECADEAGLIAKITQQCFEFGLNIIKNSEFVDPQSKTFFMRTVLQENSELDKSAFLNALTHSLPTGSQLRLLNKSRKRIVILATKEAHCLGELLMKHHCGVLDVEIAAVISNYNVLENLVSKFNIPFCHVDHQHIERSEHEKKIMSIISELAPDYLVLAKYMRILSEDFVNQLPNKIINIHHSFLPAFVGAKPYHQAFERGVKIIGATAHFVNKDLDQGPIICQDVIHVDHSFQAGKLAKAGQQLEESVLLNALQLVVREKVIVFGNRTVVF